MSSRSLIFAWNNLTEISQENSDHEVPTLQTIQVTFNNVVVIGFKYQMTQDLLFVEKNKISVFFLLVPWAALAPAGIRGNSGLEDGSHLDRRKPSARILKTKLGDGMHCQERRLRTKILEDKLGIPENGSFSGHGRRPRLWRFLSKRTSMDGQVEEAWAFFKPSSCDVSCC